MAHKCRDCTRCTESGCTGCLMIPFRLLFAPFILFRNTVVQRCPHCGHPLHHHLRDERGRFAD